MVEGLIALGFLFLLLASGMWVGICLATTGLLSLLIFTDFPAGHIVAVQLFNWNNSFVLAALPMFILMGQLLFFSKVNRQLYQGLTPLVQFIPGKLLHSNVLACTLVAAISGTSTGTLATVATVAVPELERMGYNRRLMLGSLAGAGTLGLLIPPSMTMIIYCVLVNESVGQMFVAGILPGLMVATLFMTYIAFVAVRRPEVAPPGVHYSWKEKLRGLAGIAPTAFLIAMVLGGIYLGWSTPSEAAAMGCGGAIIVGLLNRAFNWRVIKQSLAESIYVTGMIMLVMTGAVFYATSVAYLGFSKEVVNFVLSLPVNPYLILLLIGLVYIGLGCLMDGTAMLVLTVPIIYPAVLALGFESIWFGIFVVILIEVAQITPPVGFNLYVLSSISGEPTEVIVRSTIPFFLLLLLGAVIITIFPDLTLWLPQQMMAR